MTTQIALGLAADWSEREASLQFLNPHVRVGLLILALIVLRLAWRVAHPPPPLPEGTPGWQRLAAGTVHRLLYLLLLLLPVSGYVLWAWTGPLLDWWGLFRIAIVFRGGEDETWRSIAGYTHQWAGYLLLALLVLHIGAALWHEFVIGDRLVRDRML